MTNKWKSDATGCIPTRGFGFRPEAPGQFVPVPRWEALPPPRQGRAPRPATPEGSDAMRKIQRRKQPTPTVAKHAKVTARGQDIREQAARITRERNQGRGVVIIEVDDARPLDAVRYGAQEWAALTDGRSREQGPDARDAGEWAPCGTCGGAVAASDKYAGRWRVHKRCMPGLSSPLLRVQAAAAEVIGADLAREDAVLVGREVVVQPYRDTGDASPVPARGRLPRRWGHVDRKALRKAVQNISYLRQVAGLDPTECVDGPCGYCGTVVAAGWADHGHKWRTGARAPLCGPCSTVYLRRGSPSPSYWDAQRVAVAEALTGVGPQVGEPAPAGLRAFGEDYVPGEGGEPWAYLPVEAVERLRWSRWLRFGAKNCPPEHRNEARRRLDAQRRKQADMDAATAADGNVWGF